MDFKDVGKAIAKFAPTIAAALGGPLAGGAVAALTAAFGLDAGGTQAEKQTAIVAALSGATPDQLLLLKKADQDYAVKMQELGFKNVEELERISMADRDSARKREIEVKDNTPKILAYAITIGFFGVLAFMMLSDVPSGSRDVLNIMLGSLATAWISITGYYYGSTSSSKDKTALLAKADAIKN